MSSESVYQVARSWVDVGSFHKRLVVTFMTLHRQSGIFWIDLCIEFVLVLRSDGVTGIFH
jgi:hypothetical protein